MALIRFLWFTLLSLILFIAILITLIGGMFVLRVALDWFCTEDIKKWRGK